MTRFAFAGNWRLESEPVDPKSCGFRSDARAAVPKPVAVRPTKWRRVMVCESCWMGFMVSGPGMGAHSDSARWVETQPTLVVGRYRTLAGRKRARLNGFSE